MVVKLILNQNNLPQFDNVCQINCRFEKSNLTRSYFFAPRVLAGKGFLTEIKGHGSGLLPSLCLFLCPSCPKYCQFKPTASNYEF